MNFADSLIAAVQHVKNPVLVGIDPRLEDMPKNFLDRFPKTAAGVAEAFAVFGCGVIDAVQGMVAAVKFQLAFYEALGISGLAALEESARHARGRGLIVILDGKRNDIGSTADAYARAYLGKVAFGGPPEEIWTGDALTVNPYLGGDGIEPFVKAAAAEGKGLFVLVRTSNRSAVEFQDLVADGKPLYRHVAERLAKWGANHRGEAGYSLAGAVVGATYPEQLAELRALLPGVLFLVPGFGAQGGTAADVAPAFDAQGLGAIINSSRGLTFAYQRPEYARFGDDWQAAVQAAVRDMADALAAETSASRLLN